MLKFEGGRKGGKRIGGWVTCKLAVFVGVLSSL